MKKIIFFGLFIAFFKTTYAQRICSSTFNAAQVQITDNARYQRYIQMEQFISDYRNSISGGNGRLINANSLIIIPVVVHILHGGESIGVGRNISVAQI